MSQLQTTYNKTAVLPAPVAERGITKDQWLTLKNSLYPGAESESVLMVWDYCQARKLDPMKKPCHIVPMNVKDAKTGNYGYRDVVMPGVYELRTTAMRTREYMGHSRPEYGDVISHAGVEAPEWCEMEMYRWHSKSKSKTAFPVRVFFREVIGTDKHGNASQRWAKAPIQMMTKCCEAAGHREAFPDEIGGEMSAEEMLDQVHIEEPARPEPSAYPDEKLEENMAKYRELVEAGKREPHEIIAMIESNYTLTDGQRRKIENLAVTEGEFTEQEGEAE